MGVYQLTWCAANGRTLKTCYEAHLREWAIEALHEEHGRFVAGVLSVKRLDDMDDNQQAPYGELGQSQYFVLPGEGRVWTKGLRLAYDVVTHEPRRVADGENVFLVP